MLAFLLALVPALAAPSIAMPAHGYGGDATLDQYAVDGPDGHLRIVVKPEDRDGETGAEYIMYRDGQELWRRHADFALREVWFGPAGQVAGYALTSQSKSEFVVASFGVDGALLAFDAIDRSYPNFIHASLTPDFIALHSFPQADRLIVRRSDTIQDSELWRAYRWSTGEVVPFVEGADWKRSTSTLELVGEPLANDAAFVKKWRVASNKRLHEVERVPTTDLLLERWTIQQSEWGSKGVFDHNVYALIDPDGRCVWRRYVENEIESEPNHGGPNYDVINAALIQVADGAPVFRLGPLLLTETPKVAPTFRIEANANGVWTVRPESGEAYTFLKREVESPGWSQVDLNKAIDEPDEISQSPTWIDSQRSPFVALPDLDVYGATGQASARFDGVVGWQVNANGELMIIEHDKQGHFSCVRFNAVLQELGRTDIDLALRVDADTCDKKGHVLRWFPLTGGRWFVAESQTGLETEAIVEEFVVDGNTGAARPFSLRKAIGAPSTDWWAPLVVEALSFSDGGVLLNVDRAGHGDDGDLLVALDEDFDLDWMREEATERDDRPRWSSIAIVQDQVYGVDAAADLLTVWSRKGRRNGYVELDEAFARSRIPSRFLDPDRLIRWHGSELLMLEHFVAGRAIAYDVETKQTRVVTPGGDAPFGDDATGAFRAQPDGAPWLLSRAIAVRLDADGGIDQAFRAPAGVAIEPTCAQVLHDGRIAIFDAVEARLLIWDPASDEVDEIFAEVGQGINFEDELELVELADGGLVVLMEPLFGTYDELHLLPGAGQLERKSQEHEQVVTPDGKYTWEWEWPGVIHVSDAQGAPVRTIKTHQEGAWLRLIETVAFAPDGTVWVWERTDFSRRHGLHRIHYTPSGEELEVWPVDGTYHPGKGSLLKERTIVSVWGQPQLVIGITEPETKAVVFEDLPEGPIGLGPDRTLLVFELETLTLHRYKLPAELLGD